MKVLSTRYILIIALALLTGCKHGDTASREAQEAPPAQPTVVPAEQMNRLHVDDPSTFPLVAAQGRSISSSLSVTGQVQPDISREVPVLSLANGRVTALHVRLGDFVRKGQLVMEVQSPDVSTAFNAYLKAVADEQLARTTLTRDKLLFDKGAIAKSQLDVADDGETDAQADLKAAEEQLRILGVDKAHPGDTVKVYAPITGTVVAQSTTVSGAAGLNVAGVNGSLLIADLSHVWVVCDVYENDLAQVHLGQDADIHLSAYPKLVRKGTVSDIGAILDPTIRTAKVRIQVPNPDNLMRIGMFASATIYSPKPTPAVLVPATAVLHLHDRDWVFVPEGSQGDFRRVPVVSGETQPGNMVIITTGLQPGEQVVSNALQLQETTEQ
jgi:cobalt-zinc-cadmium efflux system membrane fusion protein